MIYLQQIEKEKHKIEEINHEIAKYEEIILNQKKRLGGENAAHVNGVLIQNQIKVLGHRVEKQLSELQKIKLMNSELRKGIENHRLERVQSDILYRKFEEALHTKKNEIAIIIEDSKNAYQYREKTILDIQKLQIQSDKEKKGFEEDFQEFGELIKRYQNRIYQTNIPKVISFTKDLDERGNSHTNNNNNSNNSMNMSNSRTTTANAMVSRSTTTNMSLNNSSMTRNNNNEDSSTTGSLAGTSLSLANMTMNNSSFNQSFNQQLASPSNNHNNNNNTASFAPPNYEASLARILEAFNCAREADPDIVVSKFLDQENQNFSLFNYVNTTNAEIEKFEHSIDVMHNKIDQHKGIGVSENEVKKQRTKTILDKLQKTEASIHEYEEQYKQTAESIECLKLGIHNILARIGSSNGSDAADLLSANFNGSDTVEVSDIISYLGIIEQRTNEILHAYALSQAMTHNNEHTLQLPYLANIGSDVNNNSNLKSHTTTHSHNKNSHNNNHSARRNSQQAIKMKSSIPDLIHRAYGNSNNNNNNNSNRNNNNDNSDDDEEDDEDTDERPWGRNELENITKKDLMVLQRRKKSVSMKDITMTSGHY